MITKEKIKQDLETQIEAIVVSPPAVVNDGRIPIVGINSGRKYLYRLSDVRLHRGKVLREVLGLELTAA